MGGGKDSSARARVRDRLEHAVEAGGVWVVLLAGGLLLLLQVPGLEDVLAKIGLENNTRIRTAVAVILLGSILLELRRLRRSVAPVISGDQHYQDPKAMYTALIEKASEASEPGQKQIDVLALTLFSAWPELEFFLERPEVHGWSVRLATLSCAAEPRLLWVPDGWPTESETTVNQVREFKQHDGADHRHEIEVYEYSLPPAVHGFRLGNGDIFVSTLLWRPNGRLGKHRFPYDYFPAHDVSPAAVAARARFANWFERALTSAAELSAGTGFDGAPPEVAADPREDEHSG